MSMKAPAVLGHGRGSQCNAIVRDAILLSLVALGHGSMEPLVDPPGRCDVRDAATPESSDMSCQCSPPMERRPLTVEFHITRLLWQSKTASQGCFHTKSLVPLVCRVRQPPREVLQRQRRQILRRRLGLLGVPPHGPIWVSKFPL